MPQAGGASCIASLCAAAATACLLEMMADLAMLTIPNVLCKIQVHMLQMRTVTVSN